MFYQVEKVTNIIKGWSANPDFFNPTEENPCYKVESDLIFQTGEVFNINADKEKFRGIAIKKEIEELEKLQDRPIRELLLNPLNEYAQTKINNIENQIAILRQEYNSL